MFKLIITILIFVTCDSARILVVIPTPSYSHQITLQPIWRELALRGHEVVAITTDPINNKSIPNLREIDLGFSHDIWKAAITKISDDFGMMNGMTVMVDTVHEIYERQLEHEEVQALIKNETEHFDLLICEYMGAPMFAFKERFKCPFIGFCSMDLPSYLHENIGNARHSVAYPDTIFSYPDNMNVFQRFLALAGSHFFETIFRFTFNRKDDFFIKKYFGEDYPSANDLAKSVDMVFINANPVLYPVRPVSPATVIISGGIHINDPKPLPKDLQTYFDNSKNGVIYFSLGSNVKSKDIPPRTKKVIIETLSELPYDVLWKYEEDNFPDKPKNVKLTKWAPQQDILRHPKVKLFITQGGLQSLEEAMFNHVPIICIPFFFDQHYNAQRVMDRGIGFTFDFNTMTKEEFRKAILDTIENPIFKERMKKFADLIRDEPMPALEKAIWWTEYVLRHGGAQHLKAKTIPYYQFYYLDVIALLCSILFVIYWLIKKCIKCICRAKPKQD